MPKSMSNKASGESGGGKQVKMPGSVSFGKKTCAGSRMMSKGRGMDDNKKFRKMVGG